MTDLSHVPTNELEAELRRRTALPICPCGKWATYVGHFDEDGSTIRCYGCMRAIGKCDCHA